MVASIRKIIFIVDIVMHSSPVTDVLDKAAIDAHLIWH